MAASNCVHVSRLIGTVYQQSYERNDLSRFVVQLVRNVFIISDQVCNVDIAVVLFRKDVFSDLISVKLLDCVPSEN